MDVARLREQIAETRHNLFLKGHLNENFTVLENFEREYNMGFSAREALAEYFVRLGSVLKRVEQELERVPRNVDMLETRLNLIIIYTARVGANNVLIKLNQLQNLVDGRRDTPSCQKALRELKLEHERLKSKVELYFRMKEGPPPDEISDDCECHKETSDEDN